MKTIFGGIEAGGTKFVCAWGTGPEDILAEVRFPTTTPDETLSQAIDFFKQQPTGTRLGAVGIASFGPVDLEPASPTYGYLTSTPKAGWADTDILGTVQSALGVPVGFDTDVNGAALAEYRWGSAQGLDNFIYLTIGTGVGGGAMVNGRLLHGMMHPEMGHIRLPHDPLSDPFPGSCPYHGDCLEGMTTGPALEKRWGQDPRQLSPGHPAWALEAHYLALALMNYICILSPQRIILGGGVMDQKQLFPLIHKNVQDLLQGYIQRPEIVEEIEEYIVPPALGNQVGVLGAIALGIDQAV